MSNDLRGVLRDAAHVPSADADVAGAWRRGRRMRVQRRVLSGIAIVVVAALGSIGIANLVPSGHDTGSVAPGTGTGCAVPSTATAVPSWAASANPPRGVPSVLSPDGNVLAVVFANPLRAGARTDPANKILWIVRQPPDRPPPPIPATLPGPTAK